MNSGCRSAAAASSRNRSSPAGSTGGGAQPRGLETNTWMVSQPSWTPASTAPAMPPVAETCAPIRKLAASLEQRDGEADDGATRDPAARLGVLVGDHVAEPEGVVPAQAAHAQGLLGLVLGQVANVGYLDQVGALADVDLHGRAPGRLDPGGRAGVDHLARRPEGVEHLDRAGLEASPPQLGHGAVKLVAPHAWHLDLRPADAHAHLDLLTGADGRAGRRPGDWSATRPSATVLEGVAAATAMRRCWRASAARASPMRAPTRLGTTIDGASTRSQVRVPPASRIASPSTTAIQRRPRRLLPPSAREGCSLGTCPVLGRSSRVPEAPLAEGAPGAGGGVKTGGAGLGPAAAPRPGTTGPTTVVASVDGGGAVALGGGALSKERRRWAPMAAATSEARVKRRAGSGSVARHTAASNASPRPGTQREGGGTRPCSTCQATRSGTRRRPRRASTRRRDRRPRRRAAPRARSTGRYRPARGPGRRGPPAPARSPRP